MKYTHIVFDVDGTLLDSREADLRSLQDLLTEHTGRRPPLDELDFAFGIPGLETTRRLGFADPEGALAQWEARLQDYQHTVRPFDGILPLLDALTARGCALGVATSRTRREYQADFAHNGLGGYFPVAVLADDTLRHKPHPDPLLCYLERTGATADAVLYLGDSVYDQQCAQSAGVAFALAGWGARGTREGVLRLSHPAQVLDVLDGRI